MSTSSKLFDLDFKNWHQWEPIAKTEINHFKDAGSAINRGVKFITTQLSRPLTIEYMEDYMDGIVVRSRKAERPWNEDRDWATFYQQSVDHGKAMQMFQYEQQGLWTFLLSHVSKEVLSHIQLDTSYAEIDKNKDTYDLWAQLKKSAVTKGTYNLQNLRNEWANFKQYTLNEEYHVVSLIPLREYLNSFQGYLDSLSNTPLEPTELEKANTLLAGVDSVRYQVAIFNFGLLPPDRPPSFNDVKNHLMYLDQLNRSSSTSHPSMNLVPTTINKLSVETPIIAPLPPLFKIITLHFLLYNLDNVLCVDS